LMLGRLSFDCFALLALIGSSKLSVMPPGTTVPITAQTLVIHLLAWYVNDAVLVAMAFLLLTFFLPIGARGAKFTKGYVVGFVVAEIVMKYLFGLLRLTEDWTYAVMLIFGCGDIIILSLGASWYYKVTGRGLSASVWPFVRGDVVKLIIATTCTYVFREPIPTWTW